MSISTGYATSKSRLTSWVKLVAQMLVKRCVVRMLVCIFFSNVNNARNLIGLKAVC